MARTDGARGDVADAGEASARSPAWPRPTSVQPTASGPGRRAGADGRTQGAPHVRDGLDVRRATVCTLLALVPTALVGTWNVGLQVLVSVDDQGLDGVPGWGGALLAATGLPPDYALAPACWVVGLARVVPLAAVCFAAGWVWERIFTHVRGRAPSTVFPVMVALTVLMLPPGIPLWQAALGVSVAVIVGLEIFGGSGRYVVHPAMVGISFLYFTYPASFGVDGDWVALPDAEMPRALEHAAEGGLEEMLDWYFTWQRTALGTEPGALGETSALACLLGGLLLLHARLASATVVLGGVLGLAGTAALANLLGDPARPVVGVPVHWHATLGGFAFALFFVLTDPVTSATTRGARLAYGAFFGALVVLVRVFNPAHPEGVVMALVLANVTAPLFDFAATRWNVWRRSRRLG